MFHGSDWTNKMNQNRGKLIGEVFGNLDSTAPTQPQTDTASGCDETCLPEGGRCTGVEFRHCNNVHLYANDLKKHFTNHL